MSFRKLLACLSFCALAVTLAAAPAMAQSQQPAQGQFGPRAGKGNAQAPQPGAAPGAQQQRPPAAEVIATHGSWKVQCEPPEKPDANGQVPPRQCGMVQTGANEKNPKAQLTLILLKTKQADKDVTMMRVMAPIGVFLPTGVALEVDGAAVGRVPFTRCLPQICMAFAEASADTLTKMKKGQAANFIIYEAPGLGLPIKLSLDGFAAALGELDKL